MSIEIKEVLPRNGIGHDEVDSHYNVVNADGDVVPASIQEVAALGEDIPVTVEVESAIDFGVRLMNHLNAKGYHTPEQVEFAIQQPEIRGLVPGKPDNEILRAIDELYSRLIREDAADRKIARHS